MQAGTMATVRAVVRALAGLRLRTPGHDVYRFGHEQVSTGESSDDQHQIQEVPRMNDPVLTRRSAGSVLVRDVDAENGRARCVVVGSGGG